MKKIRYLPFGYTIRTGQTVIDQQEAETVRGIFTAYIHGASLKEIAEDLTAKNIPYTERSCVWDKARISRILSFTGGHQDDKRKVETPCKAAGVGGTNTGLPQQRPVSAGVVQTRRNQCSHLLPLGTGIAGFG